ncbi:MAG TPA: SRPBCC family protein [Acidimicrobiales bacterium]|jgi:carbon monoxide dehydrogenase subunit G
MSRIRVSTFVRAPKSEVWQALRDIGSHVRWMKDAEAIRFTSRQVDGLGTTFECETKVGPFRLNDLMEVVEWRPRRAMGIRHSGLVKGTGRFTLKRIPGGTLFSWDEQLRFPWWLGGRLAALLATPVLRHVWKGNLRRLKALLETNR